MSKKRTFEAALIANQPIPIEEERSDLKRYLASIDTDDLRVTTANVTERVAIVRFEAAIGSGPDPVPDLRGLRSPPSEHNEEWTGGPSGVDAAKYRRHKLGLDPTQNVPEGAIGWDALELRSVAPSSGDLHDRLNRLVDDPEEPIEARNPEWLPWNAEAIPSEERPRFIADYLYPHKDPFEPHDSPAAIADAMIGAGIEDWFSVLAVAIYPEYTIARIGTEFRKSFLRSKPTRRFGKRLQRAYLERQMPPRWGSATIVTGNGRSLDLIIREHLDEEPAVPVV